MKKHCVIKLFLIICCVLQDANGQTLSYAVHMGGTSDDTARGMVVDAAGNVYTTGIYSDTGDFDPGTGIFNLSAQGLSDIFISRLDASGDFVWAKTIGGVNSDYTTAIDLDAAGNVYLTGHFEATVDFDPGPGTYNLTATGLGDIFVLKLDSSGNLVWVKQFTGGTMVAGTSISVSLNGNVYTTGGFDMTIDFDPGPGIYNVTSVSGSDAFISILDSSGNFVWAGLVGDMSRDITVDAAGNIFLIGIFSGTQDFDPGSGIFNMTASGIHDISISRLDASGNFVWAKKIGGMGDDLGTSLFVDSYGNVYGTGFFTGTADFDPGIGTFNMTAPGLTYVEQAFISKLDSAGNFVWARQFGGPTSERGYSVAVDNNGNVYGTGEFTGTADFDPGSGTFNLNAIVGDIYVLKLDSSGNLSWVIQAGSVGFDRGVSIELDATGNIYTSGYFLNTVDFDPGAGTYNLTSAGSTDIFVMKIADAPTGIPDNVMGLLPATIYPNPSMENIIVKLNEPIRSGVIEIISPENKVVYKEIVKSETEINIRVEHLKTGIYFVRVTTGDNIYSQKIIIQ